MAQQAIDLQRGAEISTPPPNHTIYENITGSDSDFGINFTEIPNYNFHIESDVKDAACKYVKTMLDHMEIAYHYCARQLPEAYGSFMHFGPKTKNNDWTELAINSPLSMFAIGLAISIPIIGLCYVIALYLGRCGTPLASERPFQRYWRYFLYIVIFSTILYITPGLIRAYVGIFALMTTRLDIDRPPPIDKLLNNALLQYDHIFEKNLNEGKTYIKAKLQETFQQYYKVLEDLEPPKNKSLELLAKLVNETSEVYKTNVSMVFTKEFDKKFHFIRDLYRIFLRMLTDTLGVGFNQRLLYRFSFADDTYKFMYPRMIVEYKQAIHNISLLSEKLKKRHDEIWLKFKGSKERSLEILQHFQGVLAENCELYCEQLESFGNKLVKHLQDIYDKNVATHIEDNPDLDIPLCVLKQCFFVCVVLTVLLTSIFICMTIAVLSSREPRPVFGFNKATAAKLLTINIIATFVVYSWCILQACRLYFYGRVMHGGVCNLRANSIGTITIFHSCELSDTIYTKMLREKLTSGVPYNDTFVEKKRQDALKHWNEMASQLPVKNDQEARAIYKLAGNVEKLWPAKHMTIFKSNVIEDFFNFYNPEFEKFVEKQKATKQQEYNYTNADKTMECLHDLGVNKINGELIPNYLGEFTPKWQEAFDNYKKKFQSNGIRNQVKDFFDYHHHDFFFFTEKKFEVEVTKNVTTLLRNNLKALYRWIDNSLRYRIGQCGIAADVIKSMIQRSCTCILHPLHSSWTGMLTVLLFIPPLLVALIAVTNNLKKVSVDY